MSTDEQKIPRYRVGRPWVTAAIAGCAAAIQLWPGDAAALQFDRDRIAAGELWRLWTAHLVHFGWSHLGWNLAVLVPTGVWVERVAGRRARWFYLVGPALIGGVLLVFDPFLHRYAGLSGLTVGLLALLAFTYLGRTAAEGRWLWTGVLVLLGGKIAIELIAQEPIFTRFADEPIKSVPLAHIAGFACAALVHGARRRFHV